MKRFGLAILAYLVPTFGLGFVWHLVLFENYYQTLKIYRNAVIIPFGFVSMLIQATLFALIYEKSFDRRAGTFGSRSLGYAVLGALLSWSFTTLVVAAKNVVSSVPDYLLIETAFTLVQWIMVAPLTVLAFGESKMSATARA